MKPQISVVMPVFNRMNCVGTAIESILKQSMSDFELIIIDDGSTDRTSEIIKSYRDNRIIHIKLPINCGISTSRNIGLKMSQGKYWAVMDSDDISSYERLEKQYNFLESNSEVTILGTRVVKVIDNKRIQSNHASEDSIIKARLLSFDGSCMIHPSSMMRASFLIKNNLTYPSHRTDSDQALWVDVVRHGGQFSSLPDHLLTYRRHKDNVTAEISADAHSHQKRKTFFRTNLLHMYFPELTHHECASIASAMEKNLSHQRSSLQFSLQSIHKAMTDTKSYYGESKNELIKLLLQLSQSIEKSLSQ